MDWNFLFGFEGRTNRARCWRVMLLNSLCLLIFILFVWLNLGVSFANADAKSGIPMGIAVLFGTLGPALITSIWCFAAIAIKRLHDRDRSGWWMVPFFIIPFLLDKAGDWLANPTAASVVSLVGSGLSLWAFVEIFCLRGTRGPNRFGSDPLALGNMPVDAGSHAPA